MTFSEERNIPCGTDLTGGIKISSTASGTTYSAGTGISLSGTTFSSIVDNTPVNGQTAEPISSNWAYDHAANANAHHSPTTNTWRPVSNTSSSSSTEGISRLGMQNHEDDDDAHHRRHRHVMITPAVIIMTS